MCPPYYNSCKVQLLETYDQIDLPIPDRMWPLSDHDLVQVDKRLSVGVPIKKEQKHVGLCSLGFYRRWRQSENPGR